MKKPLSDSQLRDILRRQHSPGARHLDAYARFIAPLGRVAGMPGEAFDLGQDRAAWLERLQGWGLQGQGVPEGGALLEVLHALPAQSRSLISVFHLVAYLPPAQLGDLLAAAARALAPGGLLIIETQTPDTLRAGSAPEGVPPVALEDIGALEAALHKAGFDKLVRHKLSAVEAAAAPGLKGVLQGTAPVVGLVAQKPGSVPAAEALHVAFQQTMGPATMPRQVPPPVVRAARVPAPQPAAAPPAPQAGLEVLRSEMSDMRRELEAMQAQIVHLQRTKKTKLSSRSRKVRALSDKMKMRLGRGKPADQEAQAVRAGQQEAPQHSVQQTGQAWQIEGPFDSSYSLALVNRALARALAGAGEEVTLVSAEGPGAFDPDPAFLRANPDLAAMVQAGKTGSAPRLVTRNMFPPRVADLPKGETLGGLHCWAWEETGLPADFVADFNAHLDFITVTSPHVQRVLIDNGVTVPAYVVGNGVDHIEARGADPAHLPPLPDKVTQASRIFVHVSSCFPRKGADVLLDAWAQAFAGRTDVALVIKTFDNPHNDIAARIADRDDLAQVHVISDDITPDAMAALLTRADVAVLPSRAEGFGLPVAEALMAGCRVLTTGWSGQKVFEGCPLLQFTDYRMAQAGSHLTDGDSLWAEPDVFDLAYQMKQAAAAPTPGPEAVQAARDWLLARFSWDAVAQRNIAAARDAAHRPPRHVPKVGWITTFNTRCGIATYSEHLLAHLPQGHDVTVFAPDVDATLVPDADLPEPVVRCWREDQPSLERLTAQINEAGIETLVIQFNYAFFDMAAFGEFLTAQKAAGRSVVVMMHGTNDARAPVDRQVASIAPALRACDRLFVHAVADVARLKAMGIAENVTLMSHGVLPAETLPENTQGPVIIGTYGFFLPGKGLVDLVRAVGMVRRAGHDVILRMTNAEYPQPVSAQEIAEARAVVAAEGLGDVVEIETAFLSDADTLARLRGCDLVVFPYQSSGESASGAVRYGLAAGRPVAVTPLGIFSDVADITLPLPGTDADAMAQGLMQIVPELRSGPDKQGSSGPDSGLSPRISEVQKRARAWCAARAYPAVASRLSRVLSALHNTPGSNLFDGS